MDLRDLITAAAQIEDVAYEEVINNHLRVTLPSGVQADITPNREKTHARVSFPEWYDAMKPAPFWWPKLYPYYEVTVLGRMLYGNRSGFSRSINAFIRGVDIEYRLDVVIEYLYLMHAPEAPKMAFLDLPAYWESIGAIVINGAARMAPDDYAEFAKLVPSILK